MQGGSQGQSEPQVEEEEAVQPWKEDRAADIRSLKASLLGAVAGFDRGFAAVVCHLSVFFCSDYGCFSQETQQRFATSLKAWRH